MPARALLLALAVALLSGCSMFMSSIEKPTAEVRGVAVTSVSLSGIDGAIDLDVHNPNAFGVPLSSIEWELRVGGARAVSGTVALSETIPARGIAPVHAAMRIDAEDAVAVGQQIARGVRDYELVARLHFQTRLGPISVDVHDRGTL